MMKMSYIRYGFHKMTMRYVSNADRIVRERGGLFLLFFAVGFVLYPSGDHPSCFGPPTLHNNAVRVPLKERYRFRNDISI